MNYQKQTPDYVHDILNKHNVEWYDINYYAWPQTFSDTTGPRGGFGGQSMSTFTVEAYVCDTGPQVYVCCGMYCFKDTPFKFFISQHNWIRVGD